VCVCSANDTFIVDGGVRWVRTYLWGYTYGVLHIFTFSVSESAHNTLPAHTTCANTCARTPHAQTHHMRKHTCKNKNDQLHIHTSSHTHTHTDFSRQLSEFETQADSLPLAVEWCGSDGVVLLWPNLLLVVGPYGDHTSWSLAEEEKVRPIAKMSLRCVVWCDVMMLKRRSG